jgi:hypothetical protein
MQVGDKVLISPDSRFFNKPKTNNPAYTVGRIERIRNCPSLYKLEVLWDKGPDVNYYRHEDLILANNLTLLLFSIDLKS